jgi:5-methylcytosine-specific restriction enzyme A
MPTRPKHPCRHPGCARLVAEGRYCAPHATFAQAVTDAERGNSAARGYGRRWRELRAAVLAEQPLCASCAGGGRVEAATEVDHVVPRSRGGGDEWSNLQALCKRCHSAKTAREDGGFGHVEGKAKSEARTK